MDVSFFSCTNYVSPLIWSGNIIRIKFIKYKNPITDPEILDLIFTEIRMIDHTYFCLVKEFHLRTNVLSCYKEFMKLSTV